MYKLAILSVIGAFAAADQDFMDPDEYDDYSGKLGGSKYFDLPAKDKHGIVMARLEEVKETIDYMYDEMEQLFQQKNQRTTCTGNDQMPKNTASNHQNDIKIKG